MGREFNRRKFLKLTAAASVAGAGMKIMGDNLIAKALTPGVGESFSLPPLPYAPEALEPHIDAMTMQIHHGKHHKAYVDNLNKAITESGLKTDSLESLLKNVSTHPVAIRNNGGGHFNHSMFWKLMTPGSGALSGPIADAVIAQFGSEAAFREKFNAAALQRFGSGWAWLVKDGDKLVITSTPNQDNPLMDVSDVKGVPLLGLDVWEHAYYLKYQNKRVDYINAWWNVVNWNEVNAIFTGKK
jgi:superoxide dismutase, Fe-Mn family